MITVSSKLFSLFPEVGKGLRADRLVESENIWVRDWMPVQVGNHFVSFKYDAVGGGPPGEWDGLSDIIDIFLDGGNIQLIGERAFITDIVFEANPEWGKGKLLSTLEDALAREVVIIPNDEDDFYGHSDGILAGVPGSDKVFVNELATHRKKIEKTISKLGFTPVVLPCPRGKAPYFDSLSAFGYYVNFLATAGQVFCPVFDVDEDRVALQRIGEAVKMVVRPVLCRRLSMSGGCCHCVTVDYRE